MRLRKKTSYVFILLFLLTCMTVGFSFLNNNLNINGISVINTPSWDIHFENIKITNGSITPTNAATISSATVVNYTVTLSKPGDFYEFTVDVKNSGTIDGMISSVVSKLNGTDITRLPDYLEYHVTYEDGVEILNNHLIESNKKETYKVYIGYKRDIQVNQLPTTEQLLDLSFNVTYVQATDAAQEVVHRLTGTRYTVNIYDGTGNVDSVVWIGKKTSDYISLYTTAIEAQAVFFNKPFYLKHIIESDIVKESYVCFEKDGNTYCLKGFKTYDYDTDEYLSEYYDEGKGYGVSPYFETNKMILYEAFGESNCYYNNDYSFHCSMSDLYVHIYESGYVNVGDLDRGCTVREYGASGCGE